MKPYINKIVFALVFLLVLSSCSNSSYQDCKNDCMHNKKWEAAYNTTCDMKTDWEDNVLDHQTKAPCIKYSYGKLNEYCLDYCVVSK